MASPLKQVYDHHDPYLAEPQAQETPKFRVFEGLDTTNQVKFSELVYFAQLAGFCVLTVLFSFFFLVNNWSALVALPVAGACGGLSVYGLTFLITSLKR